MCRKHCVDFVFNVAVNFFVFILMAVKYFPVLLQTIWGSLTVAVLLHFAQRCRWKSAILKFASCRVCASTAFLCCRKGSYSQHRTEDPVMYVKEYCSSTCLLKQFSGRLSSGIRFSRFTQVAQKLSNSEQLQEVCLLCAPSELEVAALASLQCELEMQLKYCPTLALAYA